MERNFMGLDSDVGIKEEVVEGDFKDSGYGRNSGVPWKLTNKAGVATTEQWTSSKASNVGSSQLTIFYGGSVSVFDDISPEKAQAIMLLAGYGYISPNVAQSKLPVAVGANRTMHGQPMGSSLPSPASVSSSQHVNHITTANKSEPARTLSSAVATAMISSAVPQARKQSLARFLNKRKERVMSAGAPYNLIKKETDSSPALERNGSGYSVTSGAGSNSMSITKEITADV